MNQSFRSLVITSQLNHYQLDKYSKDFFLIEKLKMKIQLMLLIPKMIVSLQALLLDSLYNKFKCNREYKN